jgi:RNA polymerase sigma-70 factor, ECF subfamily
LGTSERPLDPTIVQNCNVQWREPLERFAWAVLRDWSLAADAVQNGFVALSRFGGDVAPEARKAWLFQVVQREAFRIRAKENRRKEIESDAAVDRIHESSPNYAVNSRSQLEINEDGEQMRERIRSLPADQRQVLEMRVFEDQTFAKIAAELGVPLGTALSRMRLALEKLKIQYEADVTTKENHER